ncbi:MAG: pre-peptidase C-terminal domain-containing protein [Hydrococcus sp. Prado102]|nr:pre-peptidase C-terminal domain-containing protein [Hydrococcus sp. Prado102]
MAFEPNDVISSATDTGITFDNPTSYFDFDSIGNNFNVTPGLDVDLYKIQADAGDRLRIDIDARTFGSSLDSILRVFDSAGNEIAVNDDFDGLDSFISLNLTASDTYYIGVSGFSNFSYNPNKEGSGSSGGTGDYSLSIAVGSPLTIIGTNGDDFLFGDIANDSISGLGGNDFLESFDGEDTLNGGTGNDTVIGGNDNDSLLGGAGVDRLRGDAGNDTLRGDAGNDNLFGGADNDSLLGGTGNDRIFGDAGDDFLNGGDNNDFLNGGAGSDTVLGGSGDDNIIGGSSSNSFGSDLLRGQKGNDTITGGTGFDTLNGEDDNDRLTGGDGSDILNGGSGNDTLIGVSTANLGVFDQDTLTGGTGSDTFVLGNASGVFYYENSEFGDFTFGSIADFNTSQDTLQLKGSVAQYSLEFSTSGGITNAEIFYDPGASGVEELIGIVQNVSTNFNLTATYVSYV